MHPLGIMQRNVCLKNRLLVHRRIDEKQLLRNRRGYAKSEWKRATLAIGPRLMGKNEPPHWNHQILSCSLFRRYLYYISRGTNCQEDVVQNK